MTKAHVDASLSLEDRAEIIRLYQAGRSPLTLALEYRVSEDVIGHYLRKWRREQETLGKTPFYQTNRKPKNNVTF